MFAEALELSALLGSLIWIVIFILPWRPWSTREVLESQGDVSGDLSDVSVLIPARNEEDVIAQTLKSLNHQGKGLSIVLVDDQSTDFTANVARSTSKQNLQIVTGTELPGGWAGKLWALEQGRAHVKTPLILLLDADIELVPGTISALIQKMKSENLDFVSLMAELKMEKFWEKLLIPSFIYFFKLMYPFAWANDARKKFGAAAGGCILIKRSTLDSLGGFSCIQSSMIDDCSLAQKVKALGARTFIGLTHSVKSHRDYSDLGTIWNMVARSAFTQLLYSNFLLLAVTIMMASMFISPLLNFANSDSNIFVILGIFVMIATYIPTLRFYKLSPLWALLLPFIGTLYLAMTWTSAIRYWRGQRSVWKGRVYSTKAAA